MVKRFNALAILLVASGGVSFGQLLPYRSEIRENGWRVPNLSELKRTKTEELRRTSDAVVVKNTYNAQARDPSTWIETTRQGRRITNIRRCEFSWLNAYEADGQTFAVGGSCVMVDYQYLRSGQHSLSIKSYLSGVTQYTFYDEDGDGKFERRYNSSPGDEKFEILIPNWVKK